GIADGAVLVAFVGRLDYQKGVDTLLAAASHLGARGSPMNLVIAGDGPKRRLVENFIKHGEGGRYCRLLGFISDVRAVLSAADIAAMPSRWEGWPLSLGEAMACGLAVVAAPVAGIGDVLVDGVNGLMVERGSPVALADAIERLARDGELRERLGQAARRDVADKHSIDANIAAHEALYGEIAADILQG
ncbi:MAG: glycosyltransferase, partial [Phycisphaerae bacterium]|nr:glycosyltransferase [Phycisphaerae bacterium]